MKNHEDYIKKRDEILNWKDRAYEEWHKTSKGLDWSDSQHVQEVATEIRERHEREAAQAIDALVLEVIGDTETDKIIRPILPFQSDEAEINRYNKAQGRDWLRHEQRRIVQGDK